MSDFTPVPKGLERTSEGHLLIRWSDGHSQKLPPKMLLDACPCATCREKKETPTATESPLKIVGSVRPEPVSVMSMTPVGNYAYTISFSKGCNKGIYTFEYLRDLEEESVET